MQPDILIHKVNRSDKFIVLASDGIWEFLSNSEVFDFVENCEYMSPSKIASRLADLALLQWRMVCNSWFDSINSDICSIFLV